MHRRLPSIARPGSWLLVPLMVAGCAAPPVIPPSEALDRIKHVLIVPMESPPLMVEPSYAAGYAGATPVVIFSPPVPGSPGPAGTTTTIQMPPVVLDTPREQKDLDPTVLALLQPINSWNPNVALAQEALRSVRKTGSVSQEIGRLPVVADKDRSSTANAWEARILAWYNNEAMGTPIDAANIPKDADAIVEIGILNYSTLQGRLLLSVMVTLRDAISGKLLGRATANNYGKVGPLVPAIGQVGANEGTQFKLIAIQTGNPLVREALQKLGLTGGS